MTQFFNSYKPSALASEKSSEKRVFTGVPLSNNKQVNGPNSQVSQKIKNFFRINTSSNDTKDTESKHSDSGSTTKSDIKSSFRQSRFIPHLGRTRSTTVVSDGNRLDDYVSPTAQINPYFQYQGPPTLRHHNDNSVPPSPPDTPQTPSRIDGIGGAHDHQTAAGKEELARKLRRVASAPNAQGLFTSNTSNEPIPTPNLSQETLVTQHPNASTSMLLFPPNSSSLLPVPSHHGIPTPGQIRNSVAFRRTYSSNSIKVRDVEVGPGSFDKIKLIGKGDVGKVYLVREKKSSRLYAMKGML